MSFKRALWLILTALIAVAASAVAQSDSNEPQAFRLQITGVRAGILIDAEHDQLKSVGSSGSETYDHLFAGPVIGLDAIGSVYHPNFMQFTLGGEISPGYDIEKSTSTSTATNRKSLSLQGNYSANFAFLSEKPYRFNLYYSQNYGYRDYDFFDRVEVSSQSYGGNFGYQSGPVPFTLDVWRRTEDTYGQTTDTSIQETGLSFNAHNLHKWGETSLAYGLTQSDRGNLYALGSDTEQYLSIADTEAIAFGSRKQFLFNTDVGYTRRESSINPSDDMHATAGLSVQHTPTLSSSYDAAYNRASTSVSIGSGKSDSVSGGIAIRHQLYQSLTSTLHVQGMSITSDGSFTDDSGVNQTTTSKDTRVGAGLDEQYTKRLGTIGRLTMGASILVEHSTLDNGGSDIQVIAGERHSFTSSTGNGTDSFSLNVPYVDESSIVVRDANKTVLRYQKNVDYSVSTNGALTIIHRIANIPQNGSVVVDYRVHTINSGTYDTVTGAVSARVDMWKGLVSVYGRYNSMQNTNSGNGPATGAGSLNFVLANLNAYAVGAETSWRRLRAGVEYNAQDSTYSTYRSTRLFESMAFQPDAFSTLNIDLLQSHTQYIDAHRTEQDYSLMGRYTRTLNSSLGAHFDVGIDVRRGEDANETRIAVRPGLEYTAGRLEIRLGYSFEYIKYLNSTERMKNMLYISMRRSF